MGKVEELGIGGRENNPSLSGNGGQGVGYPGSALRSEGADYPSSKVYEKSGEPSADKAEGVVDCLLEERCMTEMWVDVFQRRSGKSNCEAA